MKACELKAKHGVNSRVSLTKTVRQGSIGHVKVKKKCLYAYLNIYKVFFIFFTQVVKTSKKICVLLVATFLEDHRMNKLLEFFSWEKWVCVCVGIYSGKFFLTYAYKL